MAADPGAHLTTGWEPEVDERDTLVRQAVLAHATWAVDAARLAGRPWQRTDRWAGGHVADRGVFANMVMLVQPPASLDELGDTLSEVGRLVPELAPYLLLSAWPTPDLRARGLELVGHPPLMARWPGHGPPPTPEGLDIIEVTDADQLAAFEEVLVEGYPLPDLAPVVRGELYAPDLLGSPFRFWLGMVDDHPAGTACAVTSAGVNLVEMVSTLEQHRGRGYGEALCWQATLADPGVPAVLVASDAGRPVYERMGYVAVERWTAWLRPGRA